MPAQALAHFTAAPPTVTGRSLLACSASAAALTKVRITGYGTVVTVVCGVNAGSGPSVGMAAMAHSGSLMMSHELTRSLLALRFTSWAKATTMLLITAARRVASEISGARLCGFTVV